MDDAFMETYDSTSNSDKVLDVSTDTLKMSSCHDPARWSVLDVIAWLRSCNLDQLSTVFQENEIDGSLLINDGLDDNMIKELIPNMKHRILFNSGRKKLREMAGSQQPKSNSAAAPLERPAYTTESALQMARTDSTYAVQYESRSLARMASKAHCPWNGVERSTIQLDIAQLIQPFNAIHTTLITPHLLSTEANVLLKKCFAYLYSPSDEHEQQQLDACFTTIVDEPLDATILIHNINRNHSLKPYVIDSLKRFHSLSDVMLVLSQCLDLPAEDLFLDIIHQITRYTLLICTIESLSFESQRFFGNIIRKNDLPIPLAYYTINEFKINFNPLAEILCLTHDRFMLLLGSPSAAGLGKTSLLPFLFYDKRNDSLNTDDNMELRSGCIDTVFAKLESNHSYIVFDVHGTMNTLNEDLITAIQHFCSLQLLCLTEADLQENSFLTLTMNYSAETRAKPTIIIIFDANYSSRNNNSSRVLEDFQARFRSKQWPNTVFMTVPVLKQMSTRSSFDDVRRAQRLRQTFTTCFHLLEENIEDQSRCESIFAIQSYYLSAKSSTNVCPSPVYNMDILSQLNSLFSHLNDETQNLSIITPVSHLDGRILMFEKELSAQWHESPDEIRTQLEQLRQEYKEIDQISPYADFFIKLLIKRPYIELLITEKYLEQWRAQFESILLDRMMLAKNDAMAHVSRIKQLEEQIQQETEQKNEAEIENILNQVQLMQHEYKTRQKLVNDIEKQLANIDLTIGLFCDEILALYENFPKLFASDNLLVALARKLTELMYKGFAFHILRGRPLRCHSKLMQVCLQYIQQSIKKAPLVLTVIGEQSSAKSSLLNSTFGCNFRVSAGRCTIGMYLSIVQWQDNTIVIFDTEGLLSLEESGSIFDNQMVSMAMLSSHLVLINHKGEFSSNLEHLIGMSFYAKLQIRSPLKPKLLFILRDQSDTNATGVFFRQLSKFKENLYSDSKFLKSSIDDELEINDRNVILLPNAFSSDTNPVLGIEQTWRNRTFPMKVLELRKMIFTSLTNVNLEVYTDVSHLYQKITCNWDAIDQLGPNLLACKTLYELSVMNELRDIANEIILGCVNTVNEEGRQQIDHVLSSITHENQIEFDSVNLIEQFNLALETIHNKNTEHGLAQFHLKTQRSCFALELKHKVEKMIEPPIKYTQVMLRDEFSERLHKARRDVRISNAQRRLIDTAQQEFDQNTNLPLEELKLRIETAYVTELEVCNRTVRREFENLEQITSKILKFYNTTLQSKTANTRQGNIYNLLLVLDLHQFRTACQRFEGTWECMVKREPQEAATTNPLIRAFKTFFLGSSSDEYRDELWDHFHEQLSWWFNDEYNTYKNKKLLLTIFVELLPQLRLDISKLVTERCQSSSDARIITYMIDLVENILNADFIKRNSRHLSRWRLASDLAVIALKILIDEAIKIESQRHQMEVHKAQEDLSKWRDSIHTQLYLMQNSFEQGKNLAAIVAEQIFEDIGQLLLSKILHDVTVDIIKSQFINHDAIQKQAYEESILQGNGENILKYVLDINRYFLELSLREINTSLMTIIHAHMLNAEQLIIHVLTKSNDIAHLSEDENVGLVADSIERGILQTNLFSVSTENKFNLSKVISLPIQNKENFKRGFRMILLQINNIRETLTSLTKKIKLNALAECKIRLSRRLGCQSCCPGCGAKCSRPEPHDEELFEEWHECKCQQRRCKCSKPPPVYIRSHESSYHLAQAFYGGRYHRSHKPVLQVCYQQWKTAAMILNDDERVDPIQKYYHLYHPEWYNNLNTKSIEGAGCNEDIPPADQRRAWMVVRHVLIRHYRLHGMIDNARYDPKLYPKVNALPDNFEPRWNDTELD